MPELSSFSLPRTLAILLALTGSLFAQNRTVYLTFDDGPQHGTADVLDVPKEAGVPATFFLTGSNAITIGGVEPQKELVQRELAEGHLIGNHCYIHKPMTKADYRATYDDLATEAQRTAFDNNFARNEAHFRAILGQPDLKFAYARLPGDGSTFPKLVAETNRLGMRHFSWQFEFGTNGVFKWLKAHDWQGIQGVDSEEPGLPPDKAVILFHDRHWVGENKPRLAALIKTLKEKGYSFGRLSDLPPKATTTSTAVSSPGPAQNPPVAPSKP